jgi:TPR repeat protein
LFEAAAAAGHAGSTYSIGIMKTYGYGMEPNYEHAINWYEQAPSP